MRTESFLALSQMTQDCPLSVKNKTISVKRGY
jgi:hypothetical protein